MSNLTTADILRIHLAAKIDLKTPTGPDPRLAEAMAARAAILARLNSPSDEADEVKRDFVTSSPSDEADEDVSITAFRSERPYTTSSSSSSLRDEADQDGREGVPPTCGKEDGVGFAPPLVAENTDIIGFPEHSLPREAHSYPEEMTPARGQEDGVDDDREGRPGDEDDEDAICFVTPDDASDEDPTSFVTPVSSFPMINDLAYAKVQVFRNSKTSRTLSEWVIKLQVATHDEWSLTQDQHLREFYISCAPGGPRRLRDTIRKWIAKGTLTQAFLSRFDDVVQGTNANAKMGLISRTAVTGAKAIKGQSRKARCVHDDQFAKLTLVDGAPKRVSLWLEAGAKPFEINQFKTADDRTALGTLRSEKAAGWFYEYDPHGLMRELRSDARALAALKKRQGKLKDFHPAGQIGQMIMQVCGPMSEVIEAQQHEIDELKKLVSQLISDRNKI